MTSFSFLGEFWVNGSGWKLGNWDSSIQRELCKMLTFLLWRKYLQHHRILEGWWCSNKLNWVNTEQGSVQSLSEGRIKMCKVIMSKRIKLGVRQTADLSPFMKLWHDYWSFDTPCHFLRHLSLLFFSSSVRALWIVPRLCILIFPPSREKLFVWERTSEIIHHSKQKDNLCFISDPPCRVECCHISVWDYTPPSAPPVCSPTIISKEKHPIALKAFSSRPRLCFVHFSWLWNVYIF